MGYIGKTKKVVKRPLPQPLRREPIAPTVEPEESPIAVPEWPTRESPIQVPNWPTVEPAVLPQRTGTIQ